MRFQKPGHQNDTKIFFYERSLALEGYFIVYFLRQKGLELYAAIEHGKFI